MSNVIQLAPQAGLSAEQLEKRRQGVFGSDIGAIVGLNPWAGPLDVFLDKMGRPALVPNDAMLLGTHCEAGIGKVYAIKTGAKLRATGTLQHPTFQRVGCTPDFIADHPDGRTVDLSVKMPQSWDSQSAFGEPGTDDIPDHYNAQIQWELITLDALYGIRLAHLAAPIRGKLEVFNVFADTQFQGWLMEEAHKFWRDHVQTGHPPPIDGSDAWSKYLNTKHPKQANAQKMAPTAELISLAEIARVETEEAEKHADKASAAKNQIKAIIGDMYGVDGVCSWFHVKGRTSVDYESVFAEAGVPEELIQKYTKVGEGHRTFKLTKVKK